MFGRFEFYKLITGIVFTAFIVISCSNNKLQSPVDALAKFDIFIAQDKFGVDKSIGYYGLENPYLKPVLTAKINAAAKDFIRLAKKGSFSEKDYHKVIQTGLQRFSDIYITINIEDRIRICRYFEDMVNIIGLKNCDRQLNNFIYGIDNSKNK